MTPEALEEAMTRQIILKMQCHDFGRTAEDGSFTTTVAKIALLQSCAEDAARAALAVVREAMREPSDEMRKASVGDLWDIKGPNLRKEVADGYAKVFLRMIAASPLGGDT